MYTHLLLCEKESQNIVFYFSEQFKDLDLGLPGVEKIEMIKWLIILENQPSGCTVL